MNIAIEYINELAMNKLIKECGLRVIDNAVQLEEGLFSINLNENVIMKSYGVTNCVMIDLGGNKCFLEQNDFFTITIE